MSSSVATAGIRQQNIDFLRCCAIVPVIFYHFTYAYPSEYLAGDESPYRVTWGYLGVDLFFAVSGYCIMMSMESSRSVAQFLAKRISRIQPAYVFAVLITYAVVVWHDLPGYDVTPFEALANLVWLNSLDSIEHVDGVYWSLVIELKFYFWIGFLWVFSVTHGEQPLRLQSDTGFSLGLAR